MEIELGDLCRCFDAGLAGVVNLGKAKLGDKTMVDALTPGFAALQPQDGDTLAVALERAASATEAASEATIPLVAKKGRASYLGERSSGHKDPGAASSALLLRTFAQAVGPQP
jgi:dihydroxyacetone kinase-like protein